MQLDQDTPTLTWVAWLFLFILMSYIVHIVLVCYEIHMFSSVQSSVFFLHWRLQRDWAWEIYLLKALSDNAGCGSESCGSSVFILGWVLRPMLPWLISTQLSQGDLHDVWSQWSFAIWPIMYLSYLSMHRWWLGLRIFDKADGIVSHERPWGV